MNTLKELTDYLVSVNENNSNTLKTILIVNHPVFKVLKKAMNWDFPIIFNSLNELRTLMVPWGYSLSSNSSRTDYYEFKSDKYKKVVFVAKEIFDSQHGNSLLPTTDMPENELVIKAVVPTDSADDLPF